MCIQLWLYQCLYCTFFVHRWIANETTYCFAGFFSCAMSKKWSVWNIFNLGSLLSWLFYQYSTATLWNTSTVYCLICCPVHLLSTYVYMLCTSWDFVQVATCTTLLYKLQHVRPLCVNWFNENQAPKLQLVQILNLYITYINMREYEVSLKLNCHYILRTLYKQPQYTSYIFKNNIYDTTAIALNLCIGQTLRH